jgi:hypothetical protein
MEEKITSSSFVRHAGTLLFMSATIIFLGKEPGTKMEI